MNLNEESNRTVGLPLQGVGSPYKFYHLSPYLSSPNAKYFQIVNLQLFSKTP